MRAGSTISTGIPSSSRSRPPGPVLRRVIAARPERSPSLRVLLSRLVFRRPRRGQEGFGHAARQTRRHSSHRRRAGLATFSLARTCSHGRFRRSASLHLDSSRRFNAAQRHRPRRRRERNHPCGQKGRWQGRRRQRTWRRQGTRRGKGRGGGHKGRGKGHGGGHRGRGHGKSRSRHYYRMGAVGTATAAITADMAGTATIPGTAVAIGIAASAGSREAVPD